MKKTYCDGCGCEITEDNFSHVAPIAIAYHLAAQQHPMHGHVKRVGAELLNFSGRTVSFDLCLPCYNAVGKAAIDKLKELQQQKVLLDGEAVK